MCTTRAFIPVTDGAATKSVRPYLAQSLREQVRRTSGIGLQADAA
ncbi:hypothetical protein [Streptomyces sp. NPDC093589]